MWWSKQDASGFDLATPVEKKDRKPKTVEIQTAIIYWNDGTVEKLEGEDVDITVNDTYFQIDTNDKNRYIPFTAVKKVEGFYNDEEV